MTEATVPFSVSANGRDFAHVPGGFGYRTPPAVSSVSPILGPAAGATAVVVHGWRIGVAASGVGAQIATQVECMVGGAVVPATALNASAVACSVPDALAIATASGGVHSDLPGATGGVAVPVQLSSNGQLFTPPGQLSFTVLPPPNVTSFAPVSGPTDGDTLVQLRGHHLKGGSDYRCRFGMRQVVATYDVYAGDYAPPRLSSLIL